MRTACSEHFSLAIAPSQKVYRAAALRIALVTAIVSIAVISRVGMISWPFLNDSGLYAQLGRTVAQGNVLYRDFYETKLPGAALLASIFWRAFGTCWAGYVMCQMVLALLAAAALARAIHTHYRPSAALPVFLFSVVFLNLSQAVYTGFQLETLQAFFEALAAMAALQALSDDDFRSSFAVGLCAAMAAMAKPGGAGAGVAFLLTVWLLGRRRTGHTFACLAGLAVPTALTLIYTFESGAWPYLPGVIIDISNYANGTPFNFDSLIKMGIVFCVLSWPFAVTAIRGRPIALTGRAQARTTGDLNRATAAPKLIHASVLRVFVLGWLLVDFLAILLQRRLYPYHFLPLACPAAVCFGFFVTSAQSLRMAAALLPISLLSLSWEGSSPLQLHRGSEPMAVSAFIASNTTSNDTVFADQIGRLLIETDRQPGSRLGTFFYLVNDDAAPAKYCSILLSDFEQRKPKFLVLAGNWDQQIPGLANSEILQHASKRRVEFITAWGRFRKYVAARYHQVAMIDGQRVYQRNQ